MAVPIIVGVTATGNLGPQSGPKRVIALAAAVIVSTCVGVFLRIALQDWVHGPQQPPQVPRLSAGAPVFGM
jgi:hypothetical protein